MKSNIIVVLLSLSLILQPTFAMAKREKPLLVNGQDALKKVFVKLETCSPILQWKEMRQGQDLSDKNYDIALYYALTRAGPPELGEKVFFLENINGTKVTLSQPLAPNTRFLWSIRIRDNVKKTVSGWLVHDVNGSMWEAALGMYTFYRNIWPGIKTPSKCE